MKQLNDTNKLLYKLIFIVRFAMLSTLLAVLTQSHVGAQNKPTAPEITSTIAGRVTDDTGQPLAGILVTAYRDINSFYKSVRTDIEGKYRVEGLTTGLYILKFSDEAGHYFTEYYDDKPSSSSAQELSVVGSDIVGVDASLAKAGRISGKVAILPGFGIGSVSINLYRPLENGDYWSSDLYTTVDVNEGEETQFQFEQLPEGIYKIGAFPHFSDLSSEYYNNSLTLENATTISLHAGNDIADIMIVLGENPNSSRISGKVTDEFGVPLPDISVTAYQTSTEESMANDWLIKETIRTKSDGTYQFLQLLPVDHLIRFHDEAGKYVAAYYDNATTPASATPLHLVSGTIQSEINAKLIATGAITGSVQFFNGTAPDYVSFQVYSSSDGYSEPIDSFTGYSTSGDTLFYQIPSLTPDIYRLSARALYQYHELTEFYGEVETVEQARDIVVSAGLTTTDINISIGDTTNFGKIMGTVRDESGNPLSDIEVSAYYSPTYSYNSIVTHTNQSGDYQLFLLQPGEYTVYFRDDTKNYANESYGADSDGFAKPLQVITGNVYPNINALLSLAGSISGTITMFNGVAPENSLDVSLYKATNSAWEKVDSTYVYKNYREPEISYGFKGLSPGIYRVGTADAFNPGSLTEFYNDKPSLESATNITITSGSVVTDANFVLGQDMANASIAGRTEAFGEFSPEIRVEIYKVSDSGYNSLLVYMTPNPDGTFKIAGLDAGNYRVATCFLDQYGYCAPRIYWPNTEQPEAARLIRLDSMTNFTGIDFTRFQVHLPLVSNQSGRH